MSSLWQPLRRFKRFVCSSYVLRWQTRCHTCWRLQRERKLTCWSERFMEFYRASSNFIELNRFYINVLVMNGHMWSRAPCNFLALAPLQSWSFRASWVLEGFHTPTYASCFGMFIDCCSWRFRRFNYQAFAKTHIWRYPVSWVNVKTCHCTSEKTWTRLYSSNPHKRSRLRLLVWLLQSHWLSEWGMTCHDLSTFSPPSRKFKWSKSLKG